MKDLYIQAIFNQYMGARDQARADLETYLSNAVGVGEHSDLGEEIKKKIQEIDKYSSLVSTMQSLFGGEVAPSDEPPQPSP
tara:strand:- start:1355 stop:1597 length:243 start_codon:yes stop_codon:yes gene_type:complete